MKITATNINHKVNNSSSWKVYICKNHEDAEAIYKMAFTMMPMGQDWYGTIGINKVVKDCRVPEFFHNRDYWVAVIEHNNGDWDREQKYELYIVE